MARMAKVAGTALVAIGLALLLGFSIFVLRDERFQKAALLKDRNAGNVFYEGEYFAALTLHVFLISGAAAGGLLALNGATLLLVGRLMTEQELAVIQSQSVTVVTSERELRA